MNTTPTQVKLRGVRLAFPNLFEAKAFDAEGKADFNAAFLLPKDHPQIGEIKAAMKEAAKEKWKGKAQEVYGLLDKQDRLALHDGDNKSSLEGYADNLYVSARNTTRPRVVGRNKKPLTAADGVIYGGCYVNVVLTFWAMDNKFGKRINASLGGVQFVKDGDAFSGGPRVDPDAFDDLGDQGEGVETEAAGGDAW